MADPKEVARVLMGKPPVCKHCKWWQIGVRSVEGSCRRHAPTSRDVGWTRTFDYDWCGDFVDRPHGWDPVRMYERAYGMVIQLC